MSYIDYVFNGDPNARIEASFPQPSGSASDPQLLCWTPRRILFINTGGPWTQLAQLSPNQVIQQLSPTLLATVIAKVQSDPINSPLCLPFARLLARGFKLPETKGNK